MNPAVFFLEETKYQDPGMFNLENYYIFELVRQSRDGGGGLALGCLKDLQPVWVREGDDQVEALSVEINLKCLTKMVIDESKTHILTNYQNVRIQGDYNKNR